MTSREREYHKWCRWVKEKCYVKEVHEKYTFTSRKMKLPEKPFSWDDMKDTWCMSMPTVIKHNNGARQVVNVITSGTWQKDENGKSIMVQDK